MSQDLVDFLNRVGRPAARIVGVFVLANIGLAISAAFWAWAIWGVTLPPLPGEAIGMAAMPFAYQMWDGWVRSQEKRHTEAFQFGKAQPNPHGGPAAP